MKFLTHTSSFLLEPSDFKNVIFEKIPLAPSKVAVVEGGRMVKKQDFEAEKIQILRYPTLLSCLMVIFLLEMGQNQWSLLMGCK